MTKRTNENNDSFFQFRRQYPLTSAFLHLRILFTVKKNPDLHVANVISIVNEEAVTN